MALSRLNYYTACRGLVGVGFICNHSKNSSSKTIGLFSHLATSVRYCFPSYGPWLHDSLCRTFQSNRSDV
jgi:hypothetical protein